MSFSSYSARAIILAGGRSTRMGTDKATLEINNETLLKRLIRILSPVFSGIIVSTSSEIHFGNSDVPQVIDEKPGLGPLMAIYSCLKVSPSRVNFVIACDIPEVDIRLVYTLLSYSQEYDIIVPSFSKRFVEPLFAVYNRSILPVVERQLTLGQLKITDCIPLCNTHIVPVGNNGWYRNLNTRHQFEAYISNKDSE
jgi:molybdopterin-guanine dinucleotide biosynthesis protein A